MKKPLAFDYNFFENLFKQVSYKVNLNQYRDRLVLVLNELLEEVNNKFPVLSDLIAPCLIVALKNLRSISSYVSNKNEYAKVEERKKIISTVVDILFYMQSYLFNYANLKDEISKRKRKEFFSGYCLFVNLLNNIINLHCDGFKLIKLDESKINSEKVKSFLERFYNEKFIGFYIRDGWIVTEIKSNDSKQCELVSRYGELNSRFTIKFAHKATNEDVVGLYNDFIQKKRTEAASFYGNNESGIKSQVFFEIFKKEMPLAPSGVIKKVNKAIAKVHPDCYFSQDVQSNADATYKKIIETNVAKYFAKIVANTGRSLRYIKYNWLEKFFLSFGGDANDSPDKIANRVGLNLIGSSNADEVEKFITDKHFTGKVPKYLDIIKELAAAYQGVSAVNLKIREICLLNIDNLIMLLLSDETQNNMGLIVSIFENIPIEASCYNQLYQKIKNSFGFLNSAEKLEFLSAICKREVKQKIINSDFIGLFTKQLKPSDFSSKETSQLIEIVEKHNKFLDDRLKGIGGIFRSKKEVVNNKISLDVLEALSRSKLEKVENEQKEQIEAQTKEGQKNIVNEYVEAVNKKVDNALRSMFAQKPEKEEGKKLQIHSILKSDIRLKEKKKRLVTFIKDNGFTQTEIQQIKELLAEQVKLKKQQQILANNTQQIVQQAFFVSIGRKTYELLEAMHLINTGLFQTYDNQLTGMISSGFAALGSIVPVIGSVFKAGSALIDWANQRRLMTEAKDISSLTLTGADNSILARILALAVTKLLNNHPVEKYKLINIKQTSISTLTEHLVSKLSVIFINAIGNYRDMINANFDVLANYCLEKLTEKVPTSILAVNTNIENFFRAKIVFDDEEVDVEKLLETARPAVQIKQDSLSSLRGLSVSLVQQVQVDKAMDDNLLSVDGENTDAKVAESSTVDKFKPNNASNEQCMPTPMIQIVGELDKKVDESKLKISNLTVSVKRLTLQHENLQKMLEETFSKPPVSGGERVMFFSSKKPDKNDVSSKENRQPKSRSLRARPL